MFHAVTGAMTAGPMFYLSVEMLRTGSVLSGSFIGAMGFAGFFLPGFLTSRFLGSISAAKDRVAIRLLSPVPSPVLSLLGVGDPASPADDPESNA